MASKFSKQHYQVIAGVLAKEYANYGASTAGAIASSNILRIAERLCDEFAADNERFRRGHFLSVVRGEKPVNSRPVWTCPYCEKQHKRNTNACPVLNPSVKAVR